MNNEHLFCLRVAIESNFKICTYLQEAGIENVAAKETYIKTVPFHVKSDLNLIPNADEASFLVLLGLEAVLENLRNAVMIYDHLQLASVVVLEALARI